MEEDTGVKAPLTRLRRRLSLEQSDDVKSPSTPSTPTRRRGGRLAAKPQLDLIDENAAAVSSPKTTSKVVVEQIGEKVSTPTRRSTRTKSISELPEDTGTPAKRNTRIKSNTSIVSDSIVTDSPRARRAARRNSQVGSDNETNTVTPARKTRRRSSIANNPVTVENGDEQETISEITVEEPKSNSRKSTSNNTDNNSSPTVSPRKSPRLQEKISGKSNFKTEDEKENNVQNRVNEVNTKSTLNTNESSSTQQIADKDNASQEINKSAESNTESTSTKEQSSKISNKNFDKNLPSLPKIESYNTNRHRNNSWTILSPTVANVNSYYSDNEEIKKQIKNKDKSFDLSKLSSYAISKKANKSLTESKTDEGALNISMKKSNKNNESFKDVKNENVEQPTNAELKTTDENTDVVQILHRARDVNTTSELLKLSPEIAQSTITIEDSDSNTGSTNRLMMNLQENEDQCVPVMEHHLENQTLTASLPSTEIIVTDKQNDTLLSFSSLNRSKDNLDTTRNADQNVLNNDSCEPMDIDMTIPDNVSLLDAVNNLSSSIANVSNNDKSATSIDKKSSSMQTLEVLEKSGNENKSTLILSQIKDTSCNDDIVSETPKTDVDTGMKSCDLNPNKKDDEETIKNNLSVNKITSTPLNQKRLHTMQTSTPVITSPRLNQIQIEENNKLKNELSHVETSDDTDATDKESSQEKNNFIFDQAEDAGDDYESGDSQDEEERQYFNENEIKDKGETLSTKDDISNDSDYERDSFIVSSDEEDYQLLSGSGDNLTMSDNELTMNKKSKNKYNKRQDKKQKEASREIFESRHKINTCNNFESSKVKKSKTHKRQQIESSSSESEQEIVKKGGKKNRIRLDSTHDTSKVSNGSIIKTIKKTKKLSESINKSEMSENEITNIFDESIMNKVDPLSYNEIKLDPKTPQKDLNFSTINFTLRDEVEQVEIDENMTIIDKNESLDPLLATIANDSIDDSSISENEQIKQGFDKVLSELNKKNKMTKIKEHDISLNLNKISKKASRDPILDQLNITLTGKKSKKKLPKTSKTSNELNILDEKKNDTVVPVAADNEDSSESIDIKLLFPEDTNDTESAECKHKISDDLIPLKKAEGNTDIRVDMDISEDEVWRGWKEVADDSDAPLENQYYVKHKNTSKIYDTNIEQNQDTELPQTEERDTSNVSMNASVSAKKKQKKRISSNEDTFGIDVTKNDTSLVKTPKSANKKEKLLISGENDYTTTDIQPNTSNDKTPKSDKKKNKKKKRLSESNCKEKDVNIDKSLIKTPGSEKKKKKLSESFGDEHDDKIAKSVDKSLTKIPGSERKKKKSTELIGDKHDDNIGKSLDQPLTEPPGSEEKKKKSSASITEEIDQNNTNQGSTSKKQKRKLAASINEEILQEQWNESLTTVVTEKKKRKKNKIFDTQPLDFKESQDGVPNDRADDSHMENEVLLSKKGKIHRTVDDEQKIKSSLHEHTKFTTQTVEGSDISEDADDSDAPLEIPYVKHKNTSKIYETNIEQNQATELPQTEERDASNVSMNASVSAKKKQKKRISSNGDTSGTDNKIEKSVDKSVTKILGSERKKKKLTESIGDKHDDNIGKSLDQPLTEPPGSEEKKKKSSASISEEIDQNNTNQGSTSKKQKRKLAASINEEILQEQWNESLTTVVTEKKKRKKNKIVDTQPLDFKESQDGVLNVRADDSRMENEVLLSNKGKIHRTVDEEPKIKSSLHEHTKFTTQTVEGSEQILAQNTKKDEKKRKQLNTESEKQERKNKAKRKRREDDDEGTQTKILKEHYFDKIHVPRLPAHILNDLDDKPNMEIKKKSSTVSTSQFTVEEIRKQKNKPSSYLEDSILLNDLDTLKKHKTQLKKPKVLPSVLTAAVSDCGSTTNFKVNVLPKDTKFVAQSTGVPNYKNDYLYSGRIRRVGTYEQYKRQRNFKLSKF